MLGVVECLHSSIANFLLSLPVKYFKNRLRFDKVTAKVWGLGFLEHSVSLCIILISLWESDTVWQLHSKHGLSSLYLNCQLTLDIGRHSLPIKHLDSGWLCYVTHLNSLFMFCTSSVVSGNPFESRELQGIFHSLHLQNISVAWHCSSY